MADERRAREIATYRAGKFRNTKLAKQQAAKLENMFTDMTAGEVKMVPVIVKADVQGSQEALATVAAQAVDRRNQGAMVYAAVGGVSESTSIWRLLPRPSSSASTPVRTPVRANWPEGNSVDIRYYDIIYDAVDELKAQARHVGHVDARQKGRSHRHCRDSPGVQGVQDRLHCWLYGHRRRRAPHRARLRLLRDNMVIFTGELDSLKRFKDDAKEVKRRFSTAAQHQELQRHSRR
jgi:translation initiation factor IF-2